jgi:adenylate kinase
MLVSANDRYGESLVIASRRSKESYSLGFVFACNFRYNVPMALQKIIVFMGAPGSGKGTQTKLLSEKLGYEFFSTGELSREYAKQDTELGRKIKTTIDQGIILPIEIIREIFVKKFESILSSPGVILDGFPRTIEQVKLLEELVDKYKIENFKVLFLDVDKERLLNRLSIRSQKEGRADDDVSAVERRFDEYMTKTAPVKDYYESKNILTHINGDQSIEEVHNEILEKIR